VRIRVRRFMGEREVVSNRVKRKGSSAAEAIGSLLKATI
jgi:hypothetical protein